MAQAKFRSCCVAPDLIVHGQAKLDEEEKARVLAEASIIHSLVHHFSFP